MFAKLSDASMLARKNLTGFIFEPKFEGTRVLLYKDRDDIELINRKGEDIIYKYPEFLYISQNIKAQNCVLDAVIVVLDGEGKPDFRLAEQREGIKGKEIIDKKSGEFPATIFVFDILEKDSEILADKALRERKQELQKIIEQSSLIKISPLSLDGKQFWKDRLKEKFAGVIAKDINSKYEQGIKSWTWLEINALKANDAVIVGVVNMENNPKFLLASHIEFPESDLIYVGKIEKGIDELHRKKLVKKINNIVINESALSEEQLKKVFSDKTIKKDKIAWTKPEIVVRVKNKGMTESKMLISPSFMRLKFDKNHEHCIVEL